MTDPIEETEDSPEPIDHDNPDAPATRLWCDNQGDLAMIKSGVTKTKSRHIAVKFHHCHSEYTKKSVDFDYVPSGDNLADILTKALAGPKHMALTRRMGICAPTVDMNETNLDEKDELNETAMLCSCHC